MSSRSADTLNADERSRAADDRTYTSEPQSGAGPTVATAYAVRRHDPGRYIVLGEHGRGGLGRVSRAHDEELGRDVAIKELLSRDDISELRFLREALITARLEHPGIVPVHEAGRWPDGTPFYAMKLVAGRSLRERLAERTTIDDRLGLLHNVIAVADAIAYAHGRNIIHRDLKPANIIVGEFGETIVIDWGLAKDLSTSEEPESRQRLASDDIDLTAAGIVLGTPSYMAPEQARGEPVDQRADVYAIGAMLWELCASSKVPPDNFRHRHRMLRRAGIGQDLISIIDKALEPARRYADAGALAADLKAFKSGARVGARRYSMWAIIAHWTRQHRALAASAMMFALLTMFGAVAYVHNISVERDRADTALARTERARNDLALEHAELLLRTDPTAAMAELTAYHGDDELRHRRLVAEAKGLGVATSTILPHGGAVVFLFGEADGAIVSLGLDGRLVRTRGDVSTTLARDVGEDTHFTCVPSQAMLAYTASPDGVVVVRLADSALSRIPGIRPIDLRFAPDGSRLAAIDEHGELVVWSTSSLEEIYRTTILGGSRLVFAASAHVMVYDGTRLHSISIGSGHAPKSIEMRDVVALDARVDLAVVGTAQGEITLVSSLLTVQARARLCQARVISVQLVVGANQLVFACSDGSSGLAELADGGLRVVSSFPTRGIAYAEVDPTGRYVTLVDESRSAFIYDTHTRLIHRYDGHAGQPTSIAPPTQAFPQVLTGDSSGTVRRWSAPASSARVVVQAPVPVYSFALARDDKTLLANGAEQVVHGSNLETGAAFELPGGTGSMMGLQISPDSSTMVTYTYDGTVRVWRAADHMLLRTFTGHRGPVGEVDYLDARQLVSVGEDGQLLQWTADGAESTVLFKADSPLRRLEVLGTSRHVVVHDSTGGVWDVAPDRTVRKVRAADGTTINVLRVSQGGGYLAIGTDAGAVVVYATATWQVVRAWTSNGSVRQLVFDPAQRDLVIASQARHSQLGHLHVLALDRRRAYRWTDVEAAVRDAAYSPDGEMLGFVCTDGGTWLYSMKRDVWAYANERHTDTLVAQFSADGRLFVTSDRRGAVIVRDVETQLQGTGT